MLKSVKTPKKAVTAKPYVLLPDVTSKGKPCIKLDRERSKMLSRENFLRLPSLISMAGGFMFRKGNAPAFIGLNEETICGILDTFEWQEKAVKKSRKVTPPAGYRHGWNQRDYADLMNNGVSAENMELFRAFAAFMASQGDK